MKIAVFYHCKIRGDGIPNPDLAFNIVTEQMSALKTSGLESAAKEIHIGVNGNAGDALLVGSLLHKEATLRHFNQPGEGLSIKSLQDWLPGHEDWYICYHQSKGVSYDSDIHVNWRRCMERHVIWHWQVCVRDLQSGFDTVGAHWTLRPDQRYWGGTFWWATGRYLAKLPTIDLKTVNGKSYESEVWIGRSSGDPRVRDYAGHRAMMCPQLQ